MPGGKKKSKAVSLRRTRVEHHVQLELENMLVNMITELYRQDGKEAFRVFSTCTPSLIQRQSSIQCIRLLKYADDSKHHVSAGANINS
jgi:hypothetical protein